MKISIASLFVAVVSTLLATGVNGQDLVILHTNDTHSQIEPIRVGEGKGLGGIHRRAQYFINVKKECKNVLILDAGDYNQGTPYFTIFKGDLEIELMNTMGYDVVCIGNHEFDNGQVELARRLSKAKFKTVCANYDFSETPLAKYIKPYVIINRGGKKIGIFGLVCNLNTLVSAKSLEGMVFQDPFKVAQQMADLLKNGKKCDIVIALTHVGYSAPYPNQVSDLALAKASEDIDIIIGGHSHTILKSEKIVENEEGKDVIVVQDGSRGEYVGRFDITFK